MVGVNEEYVKDRCYFLEKSTGKENDRRIFVVRNSKILERMRKRLKGQEKKRKQKILAFHLRSFLSLSVLRSSFQY